MAAKRSTYHKQSNVVSNRGQGISYEQQESIDDSILPEASELAKLKDIDAEVMPWIKERTAKEQDARIDFNNRKMGLVEKGQKMHFFADMTAMVLAFLIIMAGMAFSAFLIVEKQVVTGSIFAGATILFAANAFLNFRKQANNQQEQKR